MKHGIEGIWGFHWLSRAWYSDTMLRDAEFEDEVMVGFYSEDGGTDGEFAVRWFDLGLSGLTPQVQAFDDSWAAMWERRDLLESLAAKDNQNITPEELVEILVTLGFQDLTRSRAHE